MSIAEEIEKLREEYREELLIDRYNLHVCLEENVNSYDRWNARYVDAISDVEEVELDIKKAKRKIKQVRAKVVIRARKDKRPEIKITDSAVEALVEADIEVENVEKELLDLYEELNTARRKMLALQVAEKDFERAYYVLQALVKMYLSGYYRADSKPRIDDKDLAKKPKRSK